MQQKSTAVDAVLACYTALDVCASTSATRRLAWRMVAHPPGNLRYVKMVALVENGLCACFPFPSASLVTLALPS
jgi:hypothetical protein